MCLVDFALSYVSKKAYDVPINPNEIKSCTVSVSDIVDVDPNPNIIVIKNEHSKMWKFSWPCVICFQRAFKSKSPKEYYLKLLQRDTPQRNEDELKQGNQINEDRNKEVEGDILCDLKKHKFFLDIDHEELLNFNFFQPDEEGCNAKF